MSRLSVIKNAQIVLETGIIFDGVLVIADDRIVDFGRAGAVEIPTGATHIDAKGAYVGPGFVDIHVHGGGGYSTCFEAKKAARHFLEHGETSILATTDYSMPLDTFLAAIEATKAAAPDVPTLRGMYMEGPYTNPRYGANAHCNPWRHPIDPAEYTRLVDAAGSLARVWVVAPEREGLAPLSGLCASGQSHRALCRRTQRGSARGDSRDGQCLSSQHPHPRDERHGSPTREMLTEL